MQVPPRQLVVICVLADSHRNTAIFSYMFTLVPEMLKRQWHCQCVAPMPSRPRRQASKGGCLAARAGADARNDMTACHWNIPSNNHTC